MVGNEGLTDEIRSKYEAIYSNLISAEVMQNSPCLNMLEKNGKFASFGLIIFGIVALCIDNPNSQEIGVLVTFLIL